MAKRKKISYKIYLKAKKAEKYRSTRYRDIGQKRITYKEYIKRLPEMRKELKALRKKRGF